MNSGVLNDAELVSDSGCGVGPHRGRDLQDGSPVVPQPNTSLSLPDQGEPDVSTSLSLQDRRKQQLRLINEKLAKRHSTLQRKELQSHSVKLAAQFESPEPVSAVREESEEAVAPGRKIAPMQPTLSWETPGKSVAYRPTLYSDTSHPVSSAGDAEQSSTSTEAFTMTDPIPIYVHPPAAAAAGDLLDSESSFLPVSLLQDSLVSQDQPGHEDSLSDCQEGQNTDMYISSLLSSLNSAYGYSSLAEKSRLLSTLVGSADIPPPLPQPEQPELHREAVKIQAAYRGHLARREYKWQLKELKAALLIQATW